MHCLLRLVIVASLETSVIFVLSPTLFTFSHTLACTPPLNNMSEDHEGMSALRRDKSSRHETNSRPRVPFASRQPAQTQPRGAQHQRRPHHDRTTGAWQGVLPDAGPRRRIRVGSESDHDAPAMPKVVSGTPKLRADAQQRWDDDVKRQRLRQYPPPTHAFASVALLLL